MKYNNQDSIYWEKYLSAFKVLWESSDNLIGFIKDHEFAYSAYSDHFERISHANNFKISLGQTDFDAVDPIKLNDTISEMVNSVRKHDELIKGNRQSKAYLYVTDENTLYVAHKYPIINPETNNFLGIRAELAPFLYPHPLKTLYDMNGIKTELMDTFVDEEIRDYELTERQHMVLYLYLQRYSYTDISEQLTLLGYKMSRERVNDHLGNLKTIFNVKNKDDLIKKAIALGYDLRIPRKFVKLGIHEITNQILTS